MERSWAVRTGQYPSSPSAPDATSIPWVPVFREAYTACAVRRTRNSSLPIELISTIAGRPNVSHVVRRLAAGTRFSTRHFRRVSRVSGNAVPLDLDQQRDYGSGVSAPVAGSMRRCETLESWKCATESPVPSGLTSTLEGFAAAANGEATMLFSSPVFQLILKAEILWEV